MHIAILDAGLRARSGHHLDHAVRLVRALTAQGHTVDIYAHIEADTHVASALSLPNVRLTNLFRLSPYEIPNGPEHPLLMFRRAGAMTAEDASRVGPSDVTLWPTLTPSQAIAAAIGEPRPRTICGLDGHLNLVSPWGAEAMAEAVRAAVGTNKQIVFASLDETLAGHYAPVLAPFPIHIMPTPFDRKATPTVRPLKKIGMFGHWRDARGVNMVPSIVGVAVKLGLRVVVQDSGEIIRAGRAPEQVEFLGFVEDFAACVESCDMIVWPSDPNRYRDTPSGIIWQCIASGLPVIAPSGCLPAQILMNKGAGVFYHNPSMESLTAALKRAIEVYPTLIKTAVERAEIWAQTQGAAKQAETITSGIFPLA